ncbi:hypothetical protein IWQ60_009126 [Tieghemiomyces parasiticus]|uniref:Uncharacterized protein n=1 Tax=Tieghemiomyces parasiticus TaxID=78921 RepID=A0A9W7ZP88_9FUNG|nr:hypothetical protein IWQ60_009126 [Tieghemiomyces parasiticus]
MSRLPASRLGTVGWWSTMPISATRPACLACRSYASYSQRRNELRPEEKEAKARRQEDFVLQNFMVMGKHLRYFRKNHKNVADRERKVADRQANIVHAVPSRDHFHRPDEQVAAVQDRYSQRIAKALRVSLTAESLPVSLLSPVHWDVNRIYVTNDRKRAEVWWIPTLNDPTVTQAVLEDALVIYGDVLASYVHKRMQPRVKTKLVFRCGQKIQSLLDQVAEDVKEPGPT